MVGILICVCHKYQEAVGGYSQGMFMVVNASMYIEYMKVLRMCPLSG